MAPSSKDVQQAAYLIKQRNAADGFRRLAIEKKLAALPKDAVAAAEANSGVKKISFPPETIEGNVLNLGDGETPVSFIQDRINEIKEAMHMYWSRYRDGLMNFQTNMEFSSSAEAESQYLSTALKAVAKVDLDLFLDGLTEGCPELGIPIKMAKEVITKELEESERVDKAQGQVKISGYIQGLRSHIGDMEENDTKHMDEMGKSAKEEYAKVAKASGDQSSVVTGDGAVLLKNFQKSVTAFKAAVSAKTSSKFEEQFTEAFSKTGGNYVGPITGGLHINGSLYIECKAHLKDKAWNLTDCDDSWELWTNAPEPSRVAEALMNSMKEQGKSAIESNLEKKVNVTLDIDSGSMWSPDNYDSVTITFTDITKTPSFGTGDVLLHGDDPKEILEAWNSVIKDKVKGISAVKGKNG